MQASIHLHRNGGEKASVRNEGIASWFAIEDTGGSDFVIFIAPELVPDAQAFAESINTYCQKRIGNAV